MRYNAMPRRISILQVSKKRRAGFPLYHFGGSNPPELYFAKFEHDRLDRLHGY